MGQGIPVGIFARALQIDFSEGFQHPAPDYYYFRPDDIYGVGNSNAQVFGRAVYGLHHGFIACGVGFGESATSDAFAFGKLAGGFTQTGPHQTDKR